MTLRNFGLSFSRRSARPNAGVSWRPRHAGIGFGAGAGADPDRDAGAMGGAVAAGAFDGGASHL